MCIYMYIYIDPYLYHSIPTTHDVISLSLHLSSPGWSVFAAPGVGPHSSISRRITGHWNGKITCEWKVFKWKITYQMEVLNGQIIELGRLKLGNSDKIGVLFTNCKWLVYGNTWVWVKDHQTKWGKPPAMLNLRRTFIAFLLARWSPNCSKTQNLVVKAEATEGFYV